MKKNAWLNNQDILNYYKSSNITFTDRGFPKLAPILNKIDCNNIQLLPFNYAKSYSYGDNDKRFVHFFLQDYQFNRIWNNPQKYIEILKKFQGMIMPDFSLYMDMPKPLQIFNHYRNLWCSAYYNLYGIKVIPSANWSSEESFDFCFDGLPCNDIIFVSNIGCNKEKEAIKNFEIGFDKMIEVLTPDTIIFRGVQSSFDYFMNKYHEIKFQHVKDDFV